MTIVQGAMEHAVLDIARRKLVETPEVDGLGPRLGTGGEFSGIFLWDTAFTAMWAKYHVETLPVESSLDNLYRLQDSDGFICREYTADGAPMWPNYHPIAFAPPVLAWAELDLFDVIGDRERLRRVYPSLKKHHQVCSERFGKPDHLFVGDPWGSGMDNLPRWPREFKGSDDSLRLSEEHIHPSLLPWFRVTVQPSPGSSWNLQARYIDMSAQMAFDASCLERIASLLNENGDAKEFSREHREIGDAINERCWDVEHQFYFDLGNEQRVRRFHVGAYWTLIAGVVPQDRMGGFLAHLEDSRKFDRPVPVPSLAADDPDFRPDGGYWLGEQLAPNYVYGAARITSSRSRESGALDGEEECGGC